LKHRIRYLDGHRGVAILLVLLYHAYSRWPALVPYGAEFRHIPVFAGGWLGVNLFFMISGFVILMSLDNSTSAGEFLYRRWLRLFPAMLICSAIIFATAGFFHERPQGIPGLRDLLPGLTFIEPNWWRKILGSPQGFLEGAFWSLFVEFKFYIVAALTYFRFGRTAQPAVLFTLFLSTILVQQLARLGVADALWTVNYWLHQLSFDYFGWFAAGAACYLYTSGGGKKWLYAGVLMALVSAVFVSNNFHRASIIAACAVAIFFTASVYLNGLQKVLCNRILLYFGFVSYPLYLLHENMMISMIVKLGAYFPEQLYFALPVVPVALISGLAYLVARYLEAPLKMLLRAIFRNAGAGASKLKNRLNISTE